MWRQLGIEGREILHFLIAFLGEDMVEPVSSLHFDKSNGSVTQVGLGIGLHLPLSVCHF